MEVDLAVASAKAAFQLWRATPLSRRARVMTGPGFRH